MRRRWNILESPNFPKIIERVLSVFLLLAGLWILGDLYYQSTIKTLSYSEFKAKLAEGALAEAKLSPDSVVGTLHDGSVFMVTRVGDPNLVKDLEGKSVEFSASTSARKNLYGQVVPLLLFLGLGYAGYRAFKSPLRSFGSRAKNLLVGDQPRSGFEAVAGCDEAKEDLTELVDFLKSPQRFLDMGATLPRGVLLSGPPGTGKTLLARALAAEAGIPFFSLSGSDFVEKYVGVGASRVRSLFTQARKQAPCIVFIDEIDALGKSRQSDGGGNDEREQTLNQLLVELDGFDEDSLVVLIGATNRPEIIDPALMRPGRFDRQVLVDAPDRLGRLEILKVHTRNRNLCSDASLEELADSTPGMCGADLANVLNEGALLATRHGSSCISDEHLREALERVIAGPIRSNRVLNSALKKRVAYHEAGHALVAYHSETADPVRKISIVPRGKAALGYTMQVPVADNYLMVERELRDRVRVLLGGRAAEILIYDETSTGAENDLQRCTQMVRRMVGHFGMGESTGLLHLGSSLRDCSPEFAAQVDRETIKILQEIQMEAVSLLRKHSDELELVTKTLLDKEVLEADDFHQLLQTSAV